MIDRTLVITVTCALIWLVVVLRMVRHRRINEQFLLLWLIIAVIILVMAGSRSLLAILASLLGIHYPPSVLILAGIGSLLLILLHFSAVISRLIEENKSLAQEVAMMRWQLSSVAKKVEQDGIDGSEAVKE